MNLCELNVKNKNIYFHCKFYIYLFVIKEKKTKKRQTE